MARHFSIRLVHFTRPSCNEKPIVFGFFGRPIGFLVTNTAKSEYSPVGDVIKVLYVTSA